MSKGRQGRGPKPRSINRRARARQAEREHQRRVTVATTIPVPPAEGQPWWYFWEPKQARWYKHRPEVIDFITTLAQGQREQQETGS